MSVARTTISMPADLMKDALDRQHARRLASFSDYIQELIRRDLEEQDRLKAASGAGSPGTRAPKGKRGTPRKLPGHSN